MTDVAAPRKAAAAIQERLGLLRPSVAIVLGSGLGDLANRVEGVTEIDYGDVPGFPQTTVVGHSGKFVAGLLGGSDVLLQSGRFHLYEGHEPQTVVLPIRVFAELGIQYLVVTNAAGGINNNFAPPCLMLITDHINLMWRHPLSGPVLDGEERFPDMSNPYDPELGSLARTAALDLGIDLQEGVYAGVLGPNYETPAEVRMLDTIGADAVGMSTVPEVIVARARGLRVLGISSITNVAAGITSAALDHEEVLEAGKSLAQDLEAIVTGVLAALP
ncbi:MAG: purine-nucleoside phosphorylase [Gemmatimonadales bacterium]